MSSSPNSGHTATMPRTFAQIQPYGWTSYVRRTLSEIFGGTLEIIIKFAHPHISSDCKNRTTEYRGEHRLRCN